MSVALKIAGVAASTLVASACTATGLTLAPAAAAVVVPLLQRVLDNLPSGAGTALGSVLANITTEAVLDLWGRARPSRNDHIRRILAGCLARTAGELQRRVSASGSEETLAANLRLLEAHLHDSHTPAQIEALFDSLAVEQILLVIGTDAEVEACWWKALAPRIERWISERHCLTAGLVTVGAALTVSEETPDYLRSNLPGLLRKEIAEAWESSPEAWVGFVRLQFEAFSRMLAEAVHDVQDLAAAQSAGFDEVLRGIDRLLADQGLSVELARTVAEHLEALRRAESLTGGADPAAMRSAILPRRSAGRTAETRRRPIPQGRRRDHL